MLRATPHNESCGGIALGNIRQLEIVCAVLRDVFLAAGEVVSEQQVEHLARCGGFLRRDA